MARTYPRHSLRRMARPIRHVTTTAPEPQPHHTKDARESRNVSIWLFTCAGVVFGIVVIGGITRLTRSGLSMVDWRPQGSALPSSPEAWNEEFARYQAFPEYQVRHASHPEDFTLEDFKYIYKWEWGHRMLGRAVGVVFALPLAVFAARRYRILKVLRTRLAVMFTLGAAQGGIGWWMVQSGLHAREEGSRQDVRVSPYRLGVHLLSAFTIYTLLLDTAIKTWSASRPRQGGKRLSPRTLVRGSVMGTAALVAVTALSGAFVAGNGAGLVYNEWPKMGGRWVPADALQPGLDPAWRNLFENLSLVQFFHRWLGQTTWAAAMITMLAVARTHTGTPVTWAVALGATASLQALMGIGNLLYLVPVPLASAHQAGSLSLVTIVVFLMNALASRRGGGAGRALVRALRKC